MLDVLFVLVWLFLITVVVGLVRWGPPVHPFSSLLAPYSRRARRKLGGHWEWEWDVIPHFLIPWRRVEHCHFARRCPYHCDPQHCESFRCEHWDWHPGPGDNIVGDGTMTALRDPGTGALWHARSRGGYVPQTPLGPPPQGDTD